jgi:hypothetical protein
MTSLDSVNPALFSFYDNGSTEEASEKTLYHNLLVDSTEMQLKQEEECEPYQWQASDAFILFGLMYVFLL